MVFISYIFHPHATRYTRLVGTIQAYSFSFNATLFFSAKKNNQNWVNYLESATTEV